VRLDAQLISAGVFIPAILITSALAQQRTPDAMPPEATAGEQKTQAPMTTDAHSLTALGRTIKGQPLVDDLDQCRSLLKHEWILSNMNNADFDAAIDAIVRDAPAGMTIAQLTFRLQRVLAMGGDGHAGIGQFPGALQTVQGVRPDFLIDMSGDGYTAYRVERAAGGSVNPKFDHRFLPVKEGYPHLLAIDGKPMAEWVRAASPYIYRGPGPGVQWQAMRILQELPFLRRELHLPENPTIRVRLASADRKEEVVIDAPTNPYQRWHFAVPKPERRIIEGHIGYLWIDNPASGGAETIVRGMPELRDTRGLILDLREQSGGRSQVRGGCEGGGRLRQGKLGRTRDRRNECLDRPEVFGSGGGAGSWEGVENWCFWQNRQNTLGWKRHYREKRQNLNRHLNISPEILRPFSKKKRILIGRRGRARAGGRRREIPLTV